LVKGFYPVYDINNNKNITEQTHKCGVMRFSMCTFLRGVTLRIYNK
jgi:hypothetical protein